MITCILSTTSKFNSNYLYTRMGSILYLNTITYYKLYIPNEFIWFVKYHDQFNHNHLPKEFMFSFESEAYKHRFYGTEHNIFLLSPVHDELERRIEHSCSLGSWSLLEVYFELWGKHKPISNSLLGSKFSVGILL